MIPFKKVQLSKYTTFSIGGVAEKFYKPCSENELVELWNSLNRCEREMYIFGCGSNLLISKDVITTPIINTLQINRMAFDDVRVIAQCGVQLGTLIQRTIRKGLGGFEILAGIPGTIGGALFMNAGGRWGSVDSLVESVLISDKSGKIYKLQRNEIDFSYRSSGLQENLIIEATFKGVKENPDVIQEKYKVIIDYKSRTQPLKEKSAGCIFKNPTAQESKLSAAQLIQECGLKGKKIGGAMVSDVHSNFIINLNNAKASDVLSLIKTVKMEVYKRFKIHLQTEVEIW